MSIADNAILKRPVGLKPAAFTAARQVLHTAVQGIQSLQSLFGQQLDAVLSLILQCQGRVIVSGMGKSGHVGRKIAATMASTGTPAFFVHPAEASHGDLGMITAQDVLFCLSYSGETQELSSLLAYARRFSVPIISIVAVANSTLARFSEVCLVLPPMQEACPHGLAPTTSSTMMLVLGDAIAMALMTCRGFSAEDFKTFHPGGKLGARLQHVGDLMHQVPHIPLVQPDTLMGEALIAMSKHSFGCVGVVNGDNKLCGIITDGDLRRHMGATLLQQQVQQVMTVQPVVTQKAASAAAALAVMQQKKITGLFVVTPQGTPEGFLHIHDCLRAGVA